MFSSIFFWGLIDSSALAIHQTRPIEPTEAKAESSIVFRIEQPHQPCQHERIWLPPSSEGGMLLHGKKHPLTCSHQQHLPTLRLHLHLLLLRRNNANLAVHSQIGQGEGAARRAPLNAMQPHQVITDLNGRTIARAGRGH
jgi:hypothetical protein